MKFFDTHCHIHFADFGLPADQVYQSARDNNVPYMLAVGCTIEDSRSGARFAEDHEGVWAAVGLHPHEAKHYDGNDEVFDEVSKLAQQEKVVAIGECGLDYYYEHSPKKAQIAVFERQLQIAQDADLPISFHVRDAFDDFLPIIANFPNVRGVVHSFTVGVKVMHRLLDKGFYLGLNGIMTFTKDEAQLAMARAVPLEKMLLETDAPFLTPKSFRGNICEPKYVVETGKFLAELRGETVEAIASATTQNASRLFAVPQE